MSVDPKVSDAYHEGYTDGQFKSASEIDELKHDINRHLENCVSHLMENQALKEENKRLKDGLKAFVESFEADNVLWIAGSYEKAKLLLKEE